MTDVTWNRFAATIILVFVMSIIAIITIVNVQGCHADNRRQDMLMQSCMEQRRIVEVWSTEHGPKVVCGGPLPATVEK